MGFTPTSLLEAIQTFDVEAFAAIIWLDRKQNERALRWQTVRAELSRHEPEIKFVDILVEGESVGDEDEPEEEPDPTTSGS